MGRGTTRRVVEGPLSTQQGPSTALRAAPLPIGSADREDEGPYISPRARRMSNHFFTLALCSASVLAKTWPPVPSATK